MGKLERDQEVKPGWRPGVTDCAKQRLFQDERWGAKVSRKRGASECTWPGRRDETHEAPHLGPAFLPHFQWQES